MKLVSGTFNGTGAALRVSCGFMPDWVRIWNLEDSHGYAVALEWSINMRSADQSEGVLLDSSSVSTELTYGNGVAIYRGTPNGFSTAQTAYIERDNSPNKVDASSSASAINAWTLDTSANRTGSWGNECDTDYVGEGSRIAIRQNIDDKIYWANILAVSSNGDQSDEVTLDEAIKDGRIEFLQGMYDYLGVKASKPVGSGFVINETGILNVSGELCMFEAGTYDNDH